MCGGGGGGGGPSPAQMAQTDNQIRAQQEAAQAALDEQKREFDIQQTQATQTLADTREQQRKAQELSDYQANVASQWAEGRAARTGWASDAVNNAFASFTPEYYQNYTKAYVDHYAPEVDRQYNTARNNTAFGLARTGNLDSQTAADQNMNLGIDRGIALTDINNQAVNAGNTLKTNVTNAKSSLMGQATSDSMIGSPIAPTTFDVLRSNFSGLDSKISQFANNAGDVVNTIQATPSYSSLGSLFGNLATTGSSAATGANAYSNYQTFKDAVAGSQNPSSTSSGRVG